MKRLDTTAKVLRAQRAFDEAARMFDALPRETRRELGELIEARNDGETPPGMCIAKAFEEWLEGGRV